MTMSTYPTLRRGAKGTAVRRLQRRLNVHGAKLVVDGDFGPATERSVRGFQRHQGITVDGVVGPQTWGRLKRGVQTGNRPAKPGPKPNDDQGTLFLRANGRWMRGPRVRALQAELVRRGHRITVDGIFGPQTGQAVQNEKARLNFPSEHRNPHAGQTFWKIVMEGVPNPFAQTRPTPVPPSSATPVTGPTRFHAASTWTQYSAGVNAGSRPWAKTVNIVVHYGAIGAPITRSYDASRSLLRSFERHHVRNNGWRALGYHAGIDQLGNVFLGTRSPQTVGAHSGPGGNSYPGVVFLVGNNEQLTEAAIKAFYDLMKRWGLEARADRIIGHNRLMATSCPGPHIEGQLRRARSRY